MIVVRPRQAQLLKDYDTFGSCDPYCVVQIQAEKRQTNPHEKGGKNPKWNESLQFNTKGKFMRIEVYDKDSMTSDDLCGTGSADIRLLLSNPGKPLDVYVELKEEGGEKSGTVLLEVEYQGEALGW